MAFWPTHIRGLRQALRQLIHLFENGLTHFVFEGKTTRPFSAMSAQERDEALESWKTSKISLRRTAYTALKGLVAASYYSNPVVYPAIGYPGPPDIAEPPPTIAIPPHPDPRGLNGRHLIPVLQSPETSRRRATSASSVRGRDVGPRRRALPEDVRRWSCSKRAATTRVSTSTCRRPPPCPTSTRSRECGRRRMRRMRRPPGPNGGRRHRGELDDELSNSESHAESWERAHGIEGIDEAALMPHWVAAGERLNIHPQPEDEVNANNGVLWRGGKALGLEVALIRRNIRGCMNSGYCGMGCPVDGEPERGCPDLLAGRGEGRPHPMSQQPGRDDRHRWQARSLGVGGRARRARPPDHRQEGHGEAESVGLVRGGDQLPCPAAPIQPQPQRASAGSQHSCTPWLRWQPSSTSASRVSTELPNPSTRTTTSSGAPTRWASSPRERACSPGARFRGLRRLWRHPSGAHVAAAAYQHADLALPRRLPARR